ncbi:MAG: PEP-CTERM sorting domain-containing protein [Planctomycetota bacterium]
MRAVGVLVASVLMPVMASALTLAPGESLWDPDMGGGIFVPQFETVLPSWSLVGSLDAAISDINPGVQPNFFGTVSSRVYENPDTGTLLFAYKLTLLGNPPNTALAARMTVNGFEGWEVDGHIGADGTGFGGTGDLSPTWLDGDPVLLGRSPQGLLVIQWKIAGAGAYIGPGDYSSWAFFETNATQYKISTANVIDGSTGVADALVPAVPEPGMLSLLATGAVFVGVLIRRRLA